MGRDGAGRGFLGAVEGAPGVEGREGGVVVYYVGTGLGEADAGVVAVVLGLGEPNVGVT